MDISTQKNGNSVTGLSVDLVNKIQIGDNKAEAEFVDAFSSGLMSLLLKRTKDLDVASDCYQKTLLITLKKMRAGKIHKPQSIQVFLRRTAANVVTTHYRTENRYVNLGYQVSQSSGMVDDNVARKIDSRTVRCLLRKLLNQLSTPRDRETLRRFYLHEEDKNSICRDFGIKPEHFDRILYRAKQRVRLILENQQDVRATLHDFLGERFSDLPAL